MAKKQTLQFAVVGLIGMVAGALLVGGPLLKQMEQRLEKRMEQRLARLRPPPPPAPRRRVQPRRAPFPLPQIPLRRKPLTAYEKKLKKRKWQRLAWDLHDPQKGMLVRLALLDLKAVEGILHTKAPLRAQFLQGGMRSKYYDALHFRLKNPTKATPGFEGLGVQLWWHRDREPIQSRWLRYRRRYKAAATSQPTSQPKLPMLLLERRLSHSLIARLRPHNAIVFVTCQRSFCTQDHMQQVALLIHKRIVRNKRK